MLRLTRSNLKLSRPQFAEDESTDANELGEILHAIEKNVVRSRVLAGEPRIDGREKI